MSDSRFIPFNKMNLAVLVKKIGTGFHFLVLEPFVWDGPTDRKILLASFYRFYDQASEHCQFSYLNDSPAELLDLSDRAAAGRVQHMLVPGSDYLIHENTVVDNWENKLKKVYGKQIRKYITTHTDWKLGSKSIKVEFTNVFGRIICSMWCNREEKQVAFFELVNNR